MRKKLLRSRTGFEKPESREEAIMQNILGASNVLEPAESNIEEILKSILYNTPYTKEAEFEIEKILLAIKNNGTYDGECESRDLKILFAILNDLDYTEEAESRIEELFIEWLHQRSPINVLEGIPPLTFTSRGLPLINYLIEGNTVQSGTPTPDNPIMPQGTGERTGNLVRFYQEEMQGSFYGVDVTVKNAEITLNGTVTIGSGHWIEIGFKFGGGTESTDNVVIPCEPETPYTIATEILDGNSTQVRIIVFGTSNENRIVNIGSSLTTTFSGDISRIFISLGAEGVVFNNLKFRVMFNKGSAPLPYEPYGYKIPISSANTITPVYLGDVETTRKIRKLVLTGEEAFSYSSQDDNRYVCSLTYSTLNMSNAIGICSHFVWERNYEPTVYNRIVRANNTTFYLSLANDLLDEVSTKGFKAYLAAQYAAGTPVTVWYVLAEPTTGIVNEPIRKIGDYADTVSKEQAGVEIPTVNGSNTLDVDTTLKPSNVYIEYK